MTHVTAQFCLPGQRARRIHRKHVSPLGFIAPSGDLFSEQFKRRVPIGGAVLSLLHIALMKSFYPRISLVNLPGGLLPLLSQRLELNNAVAAAIIMSFPV